MRASDSRFARYAHIIIPPPTHTPHTQRRRVTGVACVAVVLICPLHGAGNSGVASWHWLAAHVVSMRTRRVRSLSAILCLPAGGLICILRGVPSCTRLSVDPSNGAGCHGSKESPSLKLIADQVVHAAQRHSRPPRWDRLPGTPWRSSGGCRRRFVRLGRPPGSAPPQSSRLLRHTRL